MEQLKVVSRLSWHVSRAAAMSPREVAWRAVRVGIDASGADRREHSDTRILAGVTDDWGSLLRTFRDGTGTRPLLDRHLAMCIAVEQPQLVADVLSHAERLCRGERAYFGYPAVNVGSPVDWNYDPVSDHHWPPKVATRINHRTAPSDPKWIWELNRLQHLPVLTQAWLFTGEHRFAEAALNDLDSWMAQNPPGRGIAWRGAFEAAIRAVSVSIALQGLRTSPALTADRYRAIARMLDTSARFCWRARSRFSSANNHLIGELSGLVTVAAVLPELATPASLRERALEMLALEADRQILPDGAGAEQAIAYQVFTVELLSLVLAMTRLSGHRAPPQIHRAVDRSTRYLLALLGSDDPEPRYGDDDDGFALRLGPETKRTVRQHLAIAAAVTGNRSAAQCGEPTLVAAWMAMAFDDPACAGDEVIGGGTEPGIYAPHGGLVVLRDGRRRVTMDVGPLGYLGIAAHGHADALAVTLSAHGHDLIADPGTASYYANPAWRTAHRGTRAHPTVCVDDCDQSVIGGPFLWRRQATTTVHSVDLQRGVVDAQHDGYRRLDDPVVHRRWLIAPPDDPTVVVIDLIEGTSVHDVTVSWPLHPDLWAQVSGDGHLAVRNGAAVLRLCYAGTAPLTTTEIRGDVTDALGWWSDRLEHRTPAWLVGARCTTRLPVAVLSVLHVGSAAITETRLMRRGSLLLAHWAEDGAPRSAAVVTTAEGAVVHTSTPTTPRPPHTASKGNPCPVSQ